MSFVFQDRRPVPPSPQFIRTYFSAFANDPILVGLEQTMQALEAAAAPAPRAAAPAEGEDRPGGEGDGSGAAEAEEDGESTRAYLRALRCLAEEKYGEVLAPCEQVIAAGGRHVAEALLLRATFLLLHGEGEKAQADFSNLLHRADLTDRIRSNALIKRGSLRMQNGLQTEALDDFATAIRVDPENSDIYHHRGQVSWQSFVLSSTRAHLFPFRQLNLLIDRVEEAVKDFEHSVSLRPDFALAHVQKCYTEYRFAFAHRSPMHMQTALQSFEETIAKFPDCAEGYALYGQVS